MKEPPGYMLSQIYPFDQSNDGDWTFRAARCAVDVFQEHAICNCSQLSEGDRAEIIAKIANLIRYAEWRR